MQVLVVYATKHGSTQGIAERIAAGLREAGVGAQLRSCAEAGDLWGFDGFVIGSATYLGHWRKEAAHFVRRNRAVLAGKPTWLFSSGPLAATAPGHDSGELSVAADFAAAELAAEPAEIAELTRLIGPADHRVFSGALDPAELDPAERLVRRMPGGARMLPLGDFRDWPLIDAWAAEIAMRLAQAQGDQAGPGRWLHAQ